MRKCDDGSGQDSRAEQAKVRKQLKRAGGSAGRSSSGALGPGGAGFHLRINNVIAWLGPLEDMWLDSKVH